MGWEVFFDDKGWKVLTWGNVGVTKFLFVNRLMYFMGFFGYSRSGVSEGKEEKDKKSLNATKCFRDRNEVWYC
ncbi:uncharacterized protein BJX67DRAFT_350764 [Aspergillus lucknowensis]|uniref:DUF7704 domain-containing protein n=1 Tax=Aspergillus lucknowensis TaxID=176173 RepID=A0ABR4LV51_9EURO